MDNDQERSDQGFHVKQSAQRERELRTITVKKLNPWQWAVGVASILTIVAAPLPWFRASFLGSNISASGFDVEFGTITIMLGILSLGAIVWNIISGEANPFLNDLHTALMTFGFAIATVSLVPIISYDGATAHVGAILTLVGGLMQLISSLMMRANISIELRS